MELPQIVDGKVGGTPHSCERDWGMRAVTLKRTMATYRFTVNAVKTVAFVLFREWAKRETPNADAFRDDGKPINTPAETLPTGNQSGVS